MEEGDEVIYPNPGFPIYESMINFLSAKAVPIPLREERDFRLDVNELASLITDRTKLIILNSPQNPTGGIITKQDIHDIAAAIGDRDIMVLSDEIYSRLLFEGETLQHRLGATASRTAPLFSPASQRPIP